MKKERIKVAKYFVKRVLLAIVTIFIITVIAFFTMNAIPGGPFNSEKASSPQVKAALEARYNLDKPLLEQYVIYVQGLFHGDMGISTKTGRDIAQTILESFKVSATVGGMAAAIAIVCGIVFGSIAALKRNTVVDRIIVFLSTLATAVPSFVLATILLYVFSMKLGWFQVWSADSHNYVLPVIALSLYPMSYITRLTKTSMLDALGQDYVRTAKAKGVSQVLVIFKHALRNALIPVITYVGPMIASILTGSMVVESIFTLGGLGSKFVTSITNRDYPMIMGTTIFLAVLMVGMNLISDLVYKLVDPRITFD
jgi:oligopeptide transport system permease protein